MTSAWLLIQKSYHGELMGIPVVRWAAFLALTLVVFLVLRDLVMVVRSRLKARSGLTRVPPRLLRKYALSPYVPAAGST